MLSAVLENAVDGILMEGKRLLSVLGLKKGRHKFARILEQAVIYVDMYYVGNMCIF